MFSLNVVSIVRFTIYLRINFPSRPISRYSGYSTVRPNRRNFLVASFPRWMWKNRFADFTMLRYRRIDAWTDTLLARLRSLSWISSSQQRRTIIAVVTIIDADIIAGQYVTSTGDEGTTKSVSVGRWMLKVQHFTENWPMLPTNDEQVKKKLSLICRLWENSPPPTFYTFSFVSFRRFSYTVPVIYTLFVFIFSCFSRLRSTL